MKTDLIEARDTETVMISRADHEAVSELKEKLQEAAKKIEAGIEETLTYFEFPAENWASIRTNNVIERLDAVLG